jgi:hypothetical protein
MEKIGLKKSSRKRSTANPTNAARNGAVERGNASSDNGLGDAAFVVKTAP